jgi:hypothetical protein
MTTVNLPKYGNVSSARLGKMLGPEKNATALRKTGWYGFWKMCGISTDGTKAREHNLKKMYDDFHADVIQQPAADHSNKITNNNIERFIVFNNMRNIVNKEFPSHETPPDFRVTETPSVTGMTADIQFSIGGHRIAAKSSNFLERNVIKHFVEANGKLKNDVTENSIRQQQQQQQAAQIIETHYKGHISDKTEQSTTKLRSLLSLKSVGSKVHGTFENLEPGSIIVVANATKGLSRDKWEKHSYIAIKGQGNSFTQVYELGALSILSNQAQGRQNSNIEITAKIPRKDDKAVENNEYALTKSKKGFKIQDNELSKIKYMSSKGNIFKLDIPAPLISDAYQLTVKETKNKNQKYLGAMYNCNHFIFEIIRNAQILQRTQHSP